MAGPKIGGMSSRAPQPVVAPSRAQAWWLAARPHTLTISLSPVAAGSSLAWLEHGRLDARVLVLTLLAALLIQIGTNLLNDVGDFERGADTAERLGPPRATAQGWLPASAVRRAGLGALLAALVTGMALACTGGWPIVLLGLCALACGWAYTAGPRPIAYGPLGEAFVWIFFGLASVVGTYWLQTADTSPAAWGMGHAMGAFASAVMLVNNTRDAAQDARVGKRTLAVHVGLRGCRILYGILLLLPFVLLWWLPVPLPLPWRATPMLALPMAAWLVWQFGQRAPGRGYNPLLAWTARLQLVWTGSWLVAVWGLQ